MELSESQLSKPHKLNRRELIKLSQDALQRAIPDGGALDALYDAIPKTIDDKLRYYTAEQIDGAHEKTLSWLPNSQQREFLTETNNKTTSDTTHETNTDYQPIVSVSYEVTVGSVALDNPHGAKERFTEDQKTFFVFPGVREDQIEMALRRLAAKTGLEYVDSLDQSVLKFTMISLIKESKNKFSHVDVFESLKILKNASLTVQPKSQIDNREFRLSKFDATRLTLLVTPDEPSDLNAVYSVAFHPMLANAADYRRLRLLNHDTHDQLNTAASRYIHTQMRLFYRDASVDGRPFNIGQNAIFNGIGKVPHDTSKSRRRFVMRVLHALAQANVILSSDALEKRGKVFDQAIKSDKNARIVLDYVYFLYPTAQFVEEMKIANATVKTIERQWEAQTTLEMFDPRATLDESTDSAVDTEVEKPPALTQDPRELYMQQIGIAQHAIDKLLPQLANFKVQQLVDIYESITANADAKNPQGYFLKVLESQLSDSDISASQKEEIEERKEKLSEEETASQSIKSYLKSAPLTANEFAQLEMAWEQFSVSERLQIRRFGRDAVEMNKQIKDKLGLKHYESF